jgi:hypothetical protein
MMGDYHVRFGGRGVNLDPYSLDWRFLTTGHGF